MNFLFILIIRSSRYRPYDSIQGVPGWVQLLGVVFLAYIVIRVWLALQEDKDKNQNSAK